VSSLILAFLMGLAQFSPTSTGELRLSVNDASGLGLQSGVEVVSEANRFHETMQTDAAGMLVLKRLPFGAYRLAVMRDGFAPFAAVVDIRSELPTVFHVTLNLAPLATEVTVTADKTLLDPSRTGSVNRVGADAVQQRLSAMPGRSLPDLINTQPGWLLEANGVLHPRGSEYQTQFVLDGLPLTDNRSPVYAPEIGADDVHDVNVLTGGYPAEYGRKLGGVIEVVTSGQARRGLHGSLSLGAGSFSTRNGDLAAGYGAERTMVDVSAGVAATNRYLDPPVEENFTNNATTTHASVHAEHDFGDSDRAGVIVRRGDARFLVPNEHVQELAGQRQDRDSSETAAQFSYQHIVSAHLLMDVRGFVRDVSADLRSNPFSTPIIAAQDRGLRETYVKASASGHAGSHEWKAGADLNAADVREQFSYQITNRRQFDSDTPRRFSFSGTAPDREQALFVQDQWRLGAWTMNAGLRWDHYRLVVEDSAVSPRVGVAWSWPAAELVLRASYDRAFQTPAVENLLLASSPAVQALNDSVLRLPVRPSRGNFYEAGLSKVVHGKTRVDATYYRRDMSNFADDDVLLNTGVSFPIAFQSALVQGAEFKAEMPLWHAVTASASYAYMRGTGTLPVTGGLFLGDEAAALLSATNAFPISQDQRQTVRARVSDQITRSTWIAAAAAYDSGLPVEFDGSQADAVAAYGQRIVDRVDFEAGRVRPSFTIDLSAGRQLMASGPRKLRVQVDVRNLTDRLNVINFAGLFSGTALGAPRSVAVRVLAEF
jgi:outer membrane cobalamin receptor